MPKFDYESYLWDGNIPDKSIGMKERVFQIQQTKKISELKLKIFHKKRKSKLLLKQNIRCFVSVHK